MTRRRALTWLTVVLAALSLLAPPVAPALQIQGGIQYGALFNSQSTSAANAAVAVTIPAATGEQAHVYQVAARCSAGTAALTITDGGVTVWTTAAATITTAHASFTWPTGLTGGIASAVVVTLGACGVGNTGTLSVQADRF